MSIEKEIDHIERVGLFLGPVEAVCDPRMKAHCLDPYYKHPKGCPNWNYKEGCPPHVPYFPKVYSKNVYIASVRFNFAEYLSFRKHAHPDWTDKALRNPRHWQGHVRSELRSFLFDYLSRHPEIDGEILFNPEALGINVFATCEKVGLLLEHIPEQYVYNVALIANKLVDDPNQSC